MSVIGEAFEEWKKGFKIIAYMFLIGVAGPVMLSVLLSLPIIFLSMVFGLSLDFWDENYERIAYLSIFILGPYFIGRYWDEVER